MIPAILLMGVLAGLDNLQVCSSVGLLPMHRGRRHWLAVGFVLCEAAAPVLGVVLGRAALVFSGPYSRTLAPAIMIACGGAVLISALSGKGEPETRPLFGLPLALSLDNLAAGIGISPLAYSVWTAAAIIGSVSAAMSCAGLYGAAAFRGRLVRLIPARTEFAVGGYLCILAVKMLLAGQA